MSRPTRVAALAVALIAPAAPGHAWLAPGHRQIAIDAAASLPAGLPSFFRAGAATLAHGAVEPDVRRNRATPALADREAPRHYIDLELLRGAALPETRDAYDRLLTRLRVAPRQVGELPYAIVEGAEQLALAFAEHRRWPSDEAIRASCLLAAGRLSHYLADLTQPLHTTIHHDGRVRGRSESPRTGIHSRVDGLLDTRAELGRVEPLAVHDLWATVRRELEASHARVEEVYRLESGLGARGSRPTDAVATWAAERRRAAVALTSGVWVWSWERSAAIEVPDWLRP